MEGITFSELSEFYEYMLHVEEDVTVKDGVMYGSDGRVVAKYEPVK